ncbi:MAG: alpha/beta hydrolase [Phycisphaerae bacterium]|nr:alpha/beta hydrolase [Phycisphaerae bacterium]
MHTLAHVEERTISLPGSDATMLRRSSTNPDRRDAIVFLNGLLGDSSQWRLFDQYLPPTDYADCYYIDHHYDSRKDPPTVANVVRETLGLLNSGPLAEAAPPRLTLVGSSFGGNLALYLAANRLVKPCNLALFAPGGIPEVARVSSLLGAFRTVSRIIDVSFERLFGDPRVAQKPLVQRFLKAYNERLSPRKRHYMRNMLSLTRSARSAVLTEAQLASIDADTLLLWGREDEVTPPHLCELFRQRLRRGSVFWLHAGHAGHVECAEESSAALRRFVVERARLAS